MNKTLQQLESELDHTNMLLNEAERKGNLEQIQALTNHMLDLFVELKQITKPTQKYLTHQFIVEVEVPPHVGRSIGQMVLTNLINVGMLATEQFANDPVKSELLDRTTITVKG